MCVVLALFILVFMLSGSTVDKQSLLTLEELKQEHKKRHHLTSVSRRVFPFCFTWVSIYSLLIVNNL